MEIKSIEVRHASDAVARRVQAWFERGGCVGIPDGSRSVRLPHPEKSGYALKIKGAGLNGGRVRFGTFSRTGPAAVTFDFDGRVMDDVASGHDNAYLGAASFQQATTEFHVSRILAERGIPVVPCLGYGRVETETHTAWFSLFEWGRDWTGVSVPCAGAIDDYLDANIRLSADILRLAVEHDLIGYCGYVRVPDGSFRLKDLHPFRQADPVSMSQLSWVMQVLFSLNVRCQAVQFFPAAAGAEDRPADLVTYPLRAVVPDASLDDHAALRARIVRPYLRRSPPDFTPRALHDALRGTRVGSALLDLCPERFARW